MTQDTEAQHSCKRCSEPIHAKDDRWFRHDWCEEKAAAEIEAALDEDRDIEDWFSEGGMLCPSCHADFLTFLGADEPAEK